MRTAAQGAEFREVASRNNILNVTQCSFQVRNDDFRGAASDLGAEELGGRPLQFGIDAYWD